MGAETTIGRAIALLRSDVTNAYYGEVVESTALLLECIGEIAPFWNQAYAAPYVPIIERATKLAGLIVDKHSPASTPGETT